MRFSVITVVLTKGKLSWRMRQQFESQQFVSVYYQGIISQTNGMFKSSWSVCEKLSLRPDDSSRNSNFGLGEGDAAKFWFDTETGGVHQLSYSKESQALATSGLGSLYIVNIYLKIAAIVLSHVGLRNSVSTGWFITQVRAAVLIEWVGGLEPLLHNPAGLPGSKISALRCLVNILLSHIRACICATHAPNRYDKIQLSVSE